MSDEEQKPPAPLTLEQVVERMKSGILRQSAEIIQEQEWMNEMAPNENLARQIEPNKAQLAEWEERYGT